MYGSRSYNSSQLQNMAAMVLHIEKHCFLMQACDEEKLLGHLGVVLYEYLGEEYPEVLGSILGALKAIVNVIGMTKMTPPIKDLLPRLTPILKNRHEKVHRCSCGHDCVLTSKRIVAQHRSACAGAVAYSFSGNRLSCPPC